MDFEEELAKIEKQLIPRLPVFRKSKKKQEKIETDKRDIARQLLEAGRSYREVAEALDICVGSVHKIVKEPTKKTAPLVKKTEARFSTKHLLLADHILNRIDDVDINRAPLKDKVLCAAILIDKARLLGNALPEDMPEEIVETGDAPLEQPENGEHREQREQENPDLIFKNQLLASVHVNRHIKKGPIKRVWVIRLFLNTVLIPRHVAFCYN